MKVFSLLLIFSLLLASVLGYCSYDLSQGKNHEWLSALLQNVASELAGLGIGIFLPALIATHFAKQRFNALTPDLVELIKQLRVGGTISPEAARACVVCAVKILDESSFSHASSKEPHLHASVSCPVCGMMGEELIDKGNICKYCKLPEHVWSLPPGDSKTEKQVAGNEVTH